MTEPTIYDPGNFYRMCERTGFKVRASKTRKEWTGRIIRDKSWEERHPQDFVRGVSDPQVAPDARPRQVDPFIGPLQTTLSASVSAGSNILNVVSTVRMLANDTLNVMLDTGVLAVLTINSIISTTRLQTNQKMPYSASSGNLVTDISAVSLPNIG
jgi:hypothetical protein